MGRVASARAANPLAAKLRAVEKALPAPPRDRAPIPSFLPDPAAAYRALRDHWLAKRGGAPGLFHALLVPHTTIADVVEVANHVTAALRNDVGRVDGVTGLATWHYWRERVRLIRKIVACASDDDALFSRNENLWASELRQISVLLADLTRNAAPSVSYEISLPTIRPGWDVTLDDSRASFLPDPIKTHAELLARFRPARGPLHDRDFPALLVGDVAPLAAYVTTALRKDLPILNALDARIVWQRWLQAVAVMRGVLASEEPGRAYPEVALLDSDLSLLVRGLRRARAYPGTLAREVSFPAAAQPARNSEAPAAEVVPADADADADVDKHDREPVEGPQLEIVRVEIENVAPGATVATRTFSSLREADEALAHRFALNPPPAGGYVPISFVVTWSDQRTSSGRLEVTPTVVAVAPGRGGMLRAYLFDLGRWVLSDRHAREWQRYYGDSKPAELAARRVWGHDLLDRLAADSADRGSPAGRRNRQQAMPYVGGGVPDFKPSKRAATMFGGLTLLPNPTATVEALWQRYRDANGPDSSSHEDPPAPLLAVRDLIAIANWITHELRRDLHMATARDAAVVWKKWRDLALDLRVEIRGRDPHEWSTYRAFPLRVERLATDLETARRAPGDLFESFCPWRDAYFTPTEIRPDQRGGNWRKSRLEVNSWVPS